MKKFLNIKNMISMMLSAVSCGNANTLGGKTEPSAKICTANVAREGYAFATTCKSKGKYSNLNLNDGDLSTSYISYHVVEDKEVAGTDLVNKKASVFIDLTKEYPVDYIKLYPAQGDESLFPTDFLVYTSIDGVKYEFNKDVSVTEVTADGVKVDLGGINARFVEIQTKRLVPQIALGEFEVYAQIDKTENIVLNHNDIWLYKNPDTKCDLDILYYRDGTVVDPNVKLEFTSADPSVATVDENGVISPVNYGKTDISVSDGKNISVCHVEVKDDTYDKYETSIFFESFRGHRRGGMMPSQYAEAVERLKNAKYSFIECRQAFDLAGNIFGPYFMYLCNQAGMSVLINDPEITTDGNMNEDRDGIVEKSDETILSCVKKYEYRAGFRGLYLRDEPTGDLYVKFPRIVNLINSYNPHIVAYLNQYPTHASFEQLPVTLNVTGDHSTFYHEIAAIQGGNGRLRHLSFDHYPFRYNNPYENQGYIMLNNVRKAGILYNASTAYYLNPWKLHTDYVQDSAQRYYTASVAAAYGTKNFKCFGVHGWYGTPHVIPEENITLHDFVESIHDYLFTIGKHIERSNAIEVYHTNEEPEQELLRGDFVFSQLSGENAIYSLFESLDGSGKQHVMIVNKNYTVDTVGTFKLKVKDGVSGLKILDMESGEMVPLSVAADGTVTIEIKAGHCALIELPDGYDASLPDVDSDNLALGKPAYISSSMSSWSIDTDYASMYMTDGDLTQGGWRPASYDEAPWIKIDLGEAQKIGKIKITMPSNFWMRRAKNFTVSVSSDGVSYTGILDVKEAVWNNGTKSIELVFDEIEARYVRFDINDSKNNTFGEIEIYK